MKRDGLGMPPATWIRSLGAMLVSFACFSSRAAVPQEQEEARPAIDAVETTAGETAAPAPESQSPPSATQPRFPLEAASDSGESRSPAAQEQDQPTPASADKNAVATIPATQRSKSEPPPSPPGALHIERGPNEPPLIAPRNEELVFRVRLKFGFLNPSVGKVTLTSRVEPFRPSPLLVGGPDEPSGEKCTLSAHAEGSYTVYELHNVISSTLLPQEWPRVVHRNVQSGTENRQRELLIGKKDGAFVATSRSDRHCKGCQDRAHFLEPAWAWQDEHHCPNCKRPEHRVWRDAVTREIPEQTLDMLSAVLLARSLVRDGEQSLTFTLIDKLELWQVTLSRGRTDRRELPAGNFDVVEVQLATRPPPGEKGREKDFQGLFGIHGTISIWMDAKSGVPVLISGLVPAGPFELDVSIELESFRGTPPEFVPR